jgi:uncharacterized metal-binding protein (TIGR02443 family)
VSEHWQKLIVSRFEVFSQEFPNITILSSSTSQMLDHPSFARILKETIMHPQAIADVIHRVCGYEFVPDKTAFAGALCPRCKLIDGQTSFGENDMVHYECNVCERTFTDRFTNLNYWMNHLPLGVAKAAYFKSDIWVAGGDYMQDNLYDVYAELSELLEVDGYRRIRHIICPVVIGSDSRPMHKSKGDAFEVPFDVLLQATNRSEKTQLFFEAPG